MKINKVLVSLVFLLLMSSIVYAGHVQVDRVVIKETLKTAKVSDNTFEFFNGGKLTLTFTNSSVDPSKTKVWQMRDIGKIIPSQAHGSFTGRLSNKQVVALRISDRNVEVKENSAEFLKFDADGKFFIGRGFTTTIFNVEYNKATKEVKITSSTLEFRN